ncbi:MAG TPA: DNA adenine methylase [Pseudomonadota bacterium]|nr:DNA adenine methylase [Pseudomonadota bacterium]
MRDEKTAAAGAGAVGPRPFLKWAGGKRQLLPELLSRLPAAFAESLGRGSPLSGCRYHEPFVGGGALFFALSGRGAIAPGSARLADINPELINAYQVVRDRVETLIDLLEVFRNEEDFFYEVRGQQTSNLNPIQRAARLIYLNKTCFNGLFRENRRGHFNVPYGHYATAHFCAANELRAASRALRGVAIEVSPFESLAERAQPGDFVYCDPPYAPVSRTASFTSYSSGGFDEAAQQRLADLIVELGERGVSVLLSNSAVPFTRALYERCHVEQIYAKRAINSRGDRRGPVPELLVATGPLATELQRRGSAAPPPPAYAENY